MSQPSHSSLLLAADSPLPLLPAMSDATKSKRALSDGVPSLTKIRYSSQDLRQAYKTLPPLFHSPEHHRGLSHLLLPSDAVSSQHHHHPYIADPPAPCVPRINFNTEARMYSSQFPADHQLNSEFVEMYLLEDELGSGGYGFVLTAIHRADGHEVAVKFIIKDKVPEHAWMEDDVIGRLPAEVVLLSYVNHENVVKCLDIFEDHRYFYLVQELHGSPWNKHHKLDMQPPCKYRPSSSLSTPALSPSASESSLPASEPGTPPHVFATIQPRILIGSGGTNGSNFKSDDDMPKLLHAQLSLSQDGVRPENCRRPSHDLFECIEQSENKRLTEAQARYVFAQVVDAVEYLDSHGIAHRDIKDENLVIDKNLKVKLIDFGSATSVNPGEPRPFYKQFYGTAAYASSEILLKKSYQAAPAEIWTLGVLLSYLVAGVSPFPTARDAADGRIFLSEKVVGKISDDAMDLMRRCLDCNPTTRATIAEVKAHTWLTGAGMHF